MTFSTDVLQLDCAQEATRIATAIARGATRLKRRGVVVAVSGGIDSSVCAALAVRALGRERVFCLMLPEGESSDETRVLGRLLLDHLGVAWAEENITPAATPPMRTPRGRGTRWRRARSCPSSTARCGGPG